MGPRSGHGEDRMDLSSPRNLRELRKDAELREVGAWKVNSTPLQGQRSRPKGGDAQTTAAGTKDVANGTERGS